MNDHGSLVKAIKQVDVVISTVGRKQLLDQTKIISAIKVSGNIKVVTSNTLISIMVDHYSYFNLQKYLGLHGLKGFDWVTSPVESSGYAKKGNGKNCTLY